MTQRLTESLIIDQLLEKGLVAAVDIDAIQPRDGSLLNALIDLMPPLSTELEALVKSVYRLPYAKLDGFRPDPALFNLLPAAQASQLQVVPFALEGSHLQVVTATPYDLYLEERLETLTGHGIQLLAAPAEAIRRVLDRHDGNQGLLDSVSDEFRPLMLKESEDGRRELISLESIDRETAPVIRLVNTIILAAMQRRASDIHIDIYDSGVEVRYRIDGVLTSAMTPLDIAHHESLIARLKVMAELDIAEKRMPQDGRFQLMLGEREVDFRVSLLPGVHGENVVIRILDKQTITDGQQSLSLDHLGLAPEVLKSFRKAIREPYGMVLITGPTGSGKTTTLYSALNELNNGEEKIITIEDPVEYQLNNVTQIPVNEKKGVTFAKGLRSILRHDPDKIMIGEIRDVETAQIAVQSALTGHLVFTTVHANNAFDVISRFTHMGVNVYSFISSLNCVIAQRLVRKLCPECREVTQPDDELLETSGISREKAECMTFHESRGCDHCHNTGYHGRVAITEMLDLSPRIRQMIVDKQPITEMQAVASAEGMISLRESALDLVNQGVTSLREINRVTFVD